MAIAAPRWIIVIATLLMIAAGFFGVGVTKALSAAGFRDPSAESSKAADLLTQKFGQGDLQLVLTVHAREGARSPAATSVGQEIVTDLKQVPFVAGVSSPWTVPPSAAAELVSKDGQTGLIVVGVNGGGSQGQRNAKELADRFATDHDGVTVTAGGPAMAYVEINQQSERDLLVMEALALPVSFMVLVGVFGGLLAATIPLAVGIWAIIGTAALLRLLDLPH